MITRFDWDLGNGATREGAQLEYEYPPGSTGSFRICLTVTNDAGFSDTSCSDFCIGFPFLRGDTNMDSSIDIADAIFTLSYLFADGPPPTCLDAADTNDDGAIDIADPITVLSHLFASSGDLPDPFGECGVDPTEDELWCSSFPPCEHR